MTDHSPSPLVLLKRCYNGCNGSNTFKHVAIEISKNRGMPPKQTRKAGTVHYCNQPLTIPKIVSLHVIHVRQYDIYMNNSSTHL